MRAQAPRVIAGAQRGRRLTVPRGASIRPTSDRVKESIFGILTPYVPDSRFVDVCAGIGSIGIEALSRGAREAVFIESASPCITAILANLTALGLLDRAVVRQGDALKQLDWLLATQRDPVDILFADPPYATSLARRILAWVAANPLVLRAGGLAVFEWREPVVPEGEEDIRAAPGKTLALVTTRRYGDKCLTILAREEV